MEPVTLVVIYRISFVLAAVVFALLGYRLLSGGTRLPGALFALFGMGILVGALVTPIAIRAPGGGEIVARADQERLREIEQKVGGLSQDAKEARKRAAEALTRAQQTDAGKVVATKGLPMRSLRAVGVMESRGRWLAVVEDPDGMGYVLRQGDTVGDGRVVEVTRDGIVIEGAKGERSTLRLSRP